MHLRAAMMLQGGGVHSPECAVEPQPRHCHADHRQAAQHHAQEPGSRAEGQGGPPVHGGPCGQRAPEEEPLNRWDLIPGQSSMAYGSHLCDAKAIAWPPQKAWQVLLHLISQVCGSLHQDMGKIANLMEAQTCLRRWWNDAGAMMSDEGPWSRSRALALCRAAGH